MVKHRANRHWRRRHTAAWASASFNQFFQPRNSSAACPWLSAISGVGLRNLSRSSLHFGARRTRRDSKHNNQGCSN
jgi:hypothetical protein